MNGRDYCARAETVGEMQVVHHRRGGSAWTPGMKNVVHAAGDVVGVVFAKEYLQGVGTRICDGELEAGDVERGESLLPRITHPFS